MFGITLRNLKNIFSTYKSIPNKKLVRLVKNLKKKKKKIYFFDFFALKKCQNPHFEKV
jgi:hypothetical protein